MANLYNEATENGSGEKSDTNFNHLQTGIDIGHEHNMLTLARAMDVEERLGRASTSEHSSHVLSKAGNVLALEVFKS